MRLGWSQPLSARCACAVIFSPKASGPTDVNTIYGFLYQPAQIIEVALLIALVRTQPVPQRTSSLSVLPIGAQCALCSWSACTPSCIICKCVAKSLAVGSNCLRHSARVSLIALRCRSVCSVHVWYHQDVEDDEDQRHVQHDRERHGNILLLYPVLAGAMSAVGIFMTAVSHHPQKCRAGAHHRLINPDSPVHPAVCIGRHGRPRMQQVFIKVIVGIVADMSVLARPMTWCCQDKRSSDASEHASEHIRLELGYAEMKHKTSNCAN